LVVRKKAANTEEYQGKLHHTMTFYIPSVPSFHFTGRRCLSEANHLSDYLGKRRSISPTPTEAQFSPKFVLESSQKTKQKNLQIQNATNIA